MNASVQPAQPFSAGGTARLRAAVLWLYLVAGATVLNSLILFKWDRFVNLFVGLSITQFIDAAFVGMQLEPRGAPWLYTAAPALLLDAPFVILVVVLAIRVSRLRRGSAGFAFWLYAFDSLIVTLSLAVSIVVLHQRLQALAWQDLAVIVAHGVGVWIIFRAWRGIPRAGVPLKR